MARRKINLENIKDQIIEEEAALETDSIYTMSSVGAGQENSPVKPKRKGLLFLSIILIFIVLLSIVLKIMLPQGTPIPTINIKFMCLSDIELNIGTNSGLGDRTKLLPGDTLDADIEFWLEETEDTNYNLNNSVFVKTRIYGKLDESYETDLFGYELDGNWTKSINGYYYYNKRISLAPEGQDPIVERFETSIKIQESVGNEYQGKTVYLCIEFSILQAEYDAITDVWKDAPYSWKQDMYNKYFTN